MKKIKILLLEFLIIIGITNQTFSQISTVEGFNYYNINEDAFTVDVSCVDTSIFNANDIGYYYTSLQLGEVLKNVFYQEQESVDEVIGEYVIHKRSYLSSSLGGEQFRWILIRPNDDVQRPVVHITHGGQTGGANVARILSLGVYDYVQRGYAVVFYQSGSATGNPLEALEDAGCNVECTDGSTTDCATWSPDCDINCFQQAVYLKAQFTKAAQDYSANFSSEFNLDISHCYVQGFSGGALGSLTSILTDDDNFVDDLFSNMGTLSNLSLFDDAEYTIKAVTTLAGGILDETSEDYKIAPLIDISDSNVRFLMFHGQDDFAVHPETAPLLWSNPAAILSGSKIKGSLDLKTQFDALGIYNKVIINCSACHDVFTFPCDYNDDCLGNNQSFQLGGGYECILWLNEGNNLNLNYDNPCSSGLVYEDELFYVMAQIHDYCKISASFFHADFPDSGPNEIDDQMVDDLLATNEVSALNPTDFPYDPEEIINNGHLVISDKCLQQNCTGLFFDRFGTETTNPTQLNVGFQGDYLSVVNSSPGIFQEDFTLEISFKEIDHVGYGVLFSLLENGLSGIELGITSTGFVQFKKTIGSPGSITGSTNVLDGNCHHIVLTRSGNLYGLYLDGVLQDVKKTYTMEIPNTAFYRLGNSMKEFGEKKGFNGMFRNFKIWNNEIDESLFNQIDWPSNTPDLFAEWLFDEEQGQTLTSTNQQLTMTLGSSINQGNWDPRWMQNDEMCSCDWDGITSVPVLSENNSQVTISPNPSSGIFNIQNVTKPLVVTIFTLEGKIIESLIVDGSTEISIKNEGIYFLKIESDNYTEMRKVVVSR